MGPKAKRDSSEQISNQTAFNGRRIDRAGVKNFHCVAFEKMRNFLLKSFATHAVTSLFFEAKSLTFPIITCAACVSGTFGVPEFRCEF